MKFLFINFQLTETRGGNGLGRNVPDSEKWNVHLLLILPLCIGFLSGQKRVHVTAMVIRQNMHHIFAIFLHFYVTFCTSKTFSCAYTLTARGELDLQRRNVPKSKCPQLNVTKIETWSIKHKHIQDRFRVTELTEILTNQLHGFLH